MDALEVSGGLLRQVGALGQVLAQETVGVLVGAALPGLGVDGTDIVWMVSLFYSDQWRIQFQAFTEGAGGECQYPIAVKGSYEAPSLAETSFSSKVGLELGISPEAFPELTLAVDWLRIDPGTPVCG